MSLFSVPETIYERTPSGQPAVAYKKTWFTRLGFRTPMNASGESLATTFSRPYTMFAFPAVLLPSFWFSVSAMTEIANTAGFPLNFGKGSRFGFNTAQVGYCFASGIVGAALGELCAGPLCDLLTKRTLKKGEVWKPEKLLKLTWSGLITVSVNFPPLSPLFSPLEL